LGVDHANGKTTDTLVIFDNQGELGLKMSVRGGVDVANQTPIIV